MTLTVFDENHRSNSDINLLLTNLNGKPDFCLTLNDKLIRYAFTMDGPFSVHQSFFDCEWHIQFESGVRVEDYDGTEESGIIKILMTH